MNYIQYVQIHYETMPNNSENDMHCNLFKSCFTSNEIWLCYGLMSSNCGPGTVSINRGKKKKEIKRRNYQIQILILLQKYSQLGKDLKTLNQNHLK